jgi:2-polyprenyl-6-hydroxyphenyl methylase / 3-demethylubiquinone-9 3-methyltransferase
VSSIDERELKKFDKTSDEWWDLEGEFRMLHEINPLRIDYIKSMIIKHLCIEELAGDASIFSKVELIDIGSGGGLVCVPMHNLGAKVTGLDANAHNIEAAKECANKKQLNITYVNDTVENYAPAHLGKYDVVLCLEVIEHVANPAEFVKNVGRLVGQNGLLIFSTINRTLKSFIHAIVIAEYMLNWMPKGTHEHAKFIKPSELVSMLGNSSFDLLELKGLEFSLPDKTWRLTDIIDVNYFAVFKNTNFKL